MFNKVLIANRGEIAVRIIQACKRLGVKTVAVYSTADREAMHVKMADEAVCIGSAPSSESYLVMENIISAALLKGANAIHPGYGLLSENAEFVKLCEKNKIKFIGPSARTIKLMGNKKNARQTMIKAGVPVVPGCDTKHAEDFVKENGFPIIVKAANGGGGRGIRKVYSLHELPEAISSAAKEAKACFGDGTVYMEKLITNAKHIEVQILFDSKGNTIHLGERDCSIQRKNQKMIEESPGATITPELRKALGEAAVKAAKAVKYENAGTIEFLMEPNGNFYFMEMNTRIQVEHPVTEMVTGVDLVEQQLRIASGEALGMTQKDIEPKGHAIECRINAEDPNNSFYPSAGTIEKIIIPEGVRFDTYVYEGYTISMYYDSMIGKLIVHGNDRLDAMNRMKKALDGLVIAGVSTNKDYLYDIMEKEDYMNGSFDINFIEHTKSIFRLTAWERIKKVVDEGTFEEMDADLQTNDPLHFPDYKNKLQKLQKSTGLKEAIITGVGKIHGVKTGFAVMDSSFLMGSMGWAVGEKLTRLFEHATKNSLPMIVFTASGGARMQEGIVSLMQMAKVSGAVARHSEVGLLYITVITDPTTGGVTASFAMQGDIIISEPGALIGFAGKRVIEQTIKQSLPEGFQTAEFLQDKGFIDLIVPRKNMRKALGQLLSMSAIAQMLPQKSPQIDAWKTSGKRAEYAKENARLYKSAWEVVEAARDINRPTAKKYIEALFTNFIELKGDRRYADDQAIVGGVALFEGIPVTVITQEKGDDIKDKVLRNFGCPHPEGYRKALRLMKQAEKFKRPIICIVDTQGAYCGVGAEERGQGQAIAENLAEMMNLTVPVISIVIGEGGSGGALAMAVADKVLMLENAIYSILSPEGFASILWKDASRAKEAAEVMKISAKDLLGLGIIDDIVTEDTDIYTRLSSMLRSYLAELSELEINELRERRYMKFRV